MNYDEFHKIVQMVQKLTSIGPLHGNTFCTHADPSCEKMCQKCNPYQPREFDQEEFDISSLPKPKRLRSVESMEEELRKVEKKIEEVVAKKKKVEKKKGEAKKKVVVTQISEDSSLGSGAEAGASTPPTAPVSLSGSPWFFVGKDRISSLDEEMTQESGEIYIESD